MFLSHKSSIVCNVPDRSRTQITPFSFQLAMLFLYIYNVVLQDWYGFFYFKIQKTIPLISVPCPVSLSCTMRHVHRDTNNKRVTISEYSHENMYSSKHMKICYHENDVTAEKQDNIPIVAVFIRPYCAIFSMILIKNKVQRQGLCEIHDDVIKWKHFPRYWPFVRGMHQSPVNSPYKGQWRGALMFSLICVWINGWVNNRDAGDVRRYRAHYDVTVMCWVE